MPSAVITIIAVVISLIIAVAITWPVAIAYHKKVVEAKIGSAEEKARKIIDDALKAAETKKREALLEVKEESLKTKMSLTGKPGKGARNFSVTKSAFYLKKKQ